MIQYDVFLAAGIQHEHVPIRIGNGDHKTAEYAKINRFNKVPAIKVNAYCMSKKYLRIVYSRSL